MKSIKPGRGPSMMTGFASLAAGVFGIFWIIVVAGMGGGYFALFGVIFVVVAIAQAIYSFKNARSKNRYSIFDITEGNEESDPLNEKYGNGNISDASNASDASDASADDTAIDGGVSKYCPYCGVSLEADFDFCNKCGRKLPD